MLAGGQGRPYDASSDRLESGAAQGSGTAILVLASSL